MGLFGTLRPRGVGPAYLSMLCLCILFIPIIPLNIYLVEEVERDRYRFHARLPFTGFVRLFGLSRLLGLIFEGMLAGVVAWAIVIGAIAVLAVVYDGTRHLKSLSTDSSSSEHTRPAATAVPSVSPTAPATEPSEAPAIDSVVRIVSGRALGSGFFVTDRLIATNAHVVGALRNVGIFLDSGRRVTAKVIYADRQVDFALVESPVLGVPLIIRT